MWHPHTLGLSMSDGQLGSYLSVRRIKTGKRACRKSKQTFPVRPRNHAHEQSSVPTVQHTLPQSGSLNRAD